MVIGLMLVKEAIYRLVAPPEVHTHHLLSSRPFLEHASRFSTLECAWWRDLANLNLCVKRLNCTQTTISHYHSCGFTNVISCWCDALRKTFSKAWFSRKISKSKSERFPMLYSIVDNISLRVRIWCFTEILVPVRLFSPRNWRCRADLNMQWWWDRISHRSVKTLSLRWTKSLTGQRTRLMAWSCLLMKLMLF